MGAQISAKPGSRISAIFLQLDTSRSPAMWQEHPAHPVAMGSSKKTYKIKVAQRECVALKVADRATLLSDYSKSLRAASLAIEFHKRQRITRGSASGHISFCVPMLALADNFQGGH